MISIDASFIYKYTRTAGSNPHRPKPMLLNLAPILFAKLLGGLLRHL
jgi:hypothetical protein